MNRPLRSLFVAGAMQARDRSVTAPRGSRIAPAPLDSQRAQGGPRAPRPEVHAEQRE